ncbi:methyltransferase domain-containing protein [Pseudomonas allii]|uniref:Methyltransferase domain-containing protein n=2 Tax=Pseudomonas allii TaxID=2740531 RepID=A0ACC6LE41_9PSED|nr:methyltransferase domain-containing protein [Pseudomonas allii]MDR9876704.1 methyltransferase domain-containing protein [Pseudomonas allii]NWN61227.1 class I SAM-dependent methyltransferase [Pseudomonas allii]
MGFFDNFPRFYKTSHTSPFPDRLNSRHSAIMERNREFIKGKRILDIASHDGRWSFAALQAGAAHVTGIEPRQELINNAMETFNEYGIEPSRFDFLCGDVFDHLSNKEFDVVFCLGFYYHTIRHAELFDLIERTGAKLVVIDTEVTPIVDEFPEVETSDPRVVFGNPYGVQLLLDPVDDQQMAYSDSLTRHGQTLVGRPSRSAVRFIAKHFGYTTNTFDWNEYISEKPEVKSALVDYSEGWRDTFYCSK